MLKNSSELHSACLHISAAVRRPPETTREANSDRGITSCSGSRSVAAICGQAEFVPCFLSALVDHAVVLISTLLLPALGPALAPTCTYTGRPRLHTVARNLACSCLQQQQKNICICTGTPATSANGGTCESATAHSKASKASHLHQAGLELCPARAHTHAVVVAQVVGAHPAAIALAGRVDWLLALAQAWRHGSMATWQWHAGRSMLEHTR